MHEQEKKEMRARRGRARPPISIPTMRPCSTKEPLVGVLGVVASSVRASEQGSIWVPGSHYCASLECWEHHLPLLTPVSTTSSLLWYGHEAIFFVRYVPFYNAIIFIWSTKSITTYNIYICLYMYSK